MFDFRIFFTISTVWLSLGLTVSLCLSYDPILSCLLKRCKLSPIQLFPLEPLEHFSSPPSQT